MSQPRLALFLLGAPQVEREGKPVEIVRRKAMALLAYLAVSGESHRREALMALDCENGEYCTVYGQFRDGAGNESLVIDQAIQLQLAAGNTLYLPMIRK